jgi:hypothetical protein
MTLDPDHHDTAEGELPAEDARAREPVPGWPTGPSPRPVSGWLRPSQTEPTGRYVAVALVGGGLFVLVVILWMMSLRAMV